MTHDRFSSLGTSWWGIGLASLLGLYAVGSVLIGRPPAHVSLVAAVLAIAGALWRFPRWSLTAAGWVTGWLSFAAIGALVQLFTWDASPLPMRGLIGLGMVLVFLPMPAAWMALARRRSEAVPKFIWLLYGAFVGLSFITTIASYGANISAIRFLWFPELFVIVPGLVAVLGGALVAQRHGAAAALAAVGAFLVPYTEIVDPDYFLYVIDPQQASIVTLAMYAPLVVCPVWALAARSVLGQKLGILVPWALALAISAVLPGLIRSAHSRLRWDPSMWVTSVVTAVQLFLIVLLAVLWYERLKMNPDDVRDRPARLRAIELLGRTI